MHRGQNMVKQKTKLSKKLKLNENLGKFINFGEVGEIFKFCGNKGEWNMHHLIKGTPLTTVL